MRKTIIEREFVQAYCDTDLELIHVEWRGLATSEEYRSLYGTVISFWATQKNIHYFISDIRNQAGVVSPEDRKWFQENAIPAAKEYGLKKAAIIFDGSIFKKYYMNLILSTTNVLKIPSKLVNTEAEAFDFLGIDAGKISR